jgi:hypothetical protein
MLLRTSVMEALIFKVPAEVGGVEVARQVVQAWAMQPGEAYISSYEHAAPPP